MEGISQYLLSVIAAAIISGIAVNIFGKKGLYASAVKLIAGLFLVVTVMSPWTKLQFEDISSYFLDMQTDADLIVEEGEEIAVEAAVAIIKEEVEAYILDKACSLDVDIEVNVTFDTSDPLLPNAITIKGTASPYVKRQLQQMISDDLGIPKENQAWI